MVVAEGSVRRMIASWLAGTGLLKGGGVWGGWGEVSGLVADKDALPSF